MELSLRRAKEEEEQQRCMVSIWNVMVELEGFDSGTEHVYFVCVVFGLAHVDSTGIACVVLSCSSIFGQSRVGCWKSQGKYISSARTGQRRLNRF